jgi:RNA polymerase-interacting CarD/CdnL/TRCF family regulator
MTDRATVAIDKDEKPVLDQAQEHLEEELNGISSTKGETVVHLCPEYVENKE